MIWGIEYKGYVMKIKETVERECCQFKDLKPYQARVSEELFPMRKYLRFCIHCGRVVRLSSRMDAAGGTEDCYVDDLLVDYDKSPEEKKSKNSEKRNYMVELDGLKDLGLIDRIDIKNGGRHVVVKSDGYSWEYWPGTNRWRLQGQGEVHDTDFIDMIKEHFRESKEYRQSVNRTDISLEDLEEISFP